jgi:sulfonate transport system permease protein
MADMTLQDVALPGTGVAARPADRPTTRGWRLPSGLIGLALPLGLALIWEVCCRAGLVPPNLLPSPSAIGLTLWHLAERGELWVHLGATLWRMALGFLLGGAAGTLIGAVSGAVPLIRRLIDPTIQGLRSVPSIAWIPLFILWLGIFEISKVALIAVGVFFPVYLNLVLGIGQVDRKLIEVGRIHRLSRWALIRRVLLPAALPAYLTGLRSGLGLGWMFVVAAELMGASEGVGFLLIDGQQTGRPALVIGAILLFALLGKASDVLLAWLGRVLLAWQDVAAEAAP